MDVVRLGLQIRALRRRRGWTQAQLASRAGLSRATVGLLERGRGDRLTFATVVRVAWALNARLRVQLLWQGEELDRLLDEAHASLVDRVVRLLTDAGWVARTEVTFAVRGERGSIDVLGWHPPAASLLVIEVKSVVPDVQATVAGIDRKVRLATTIAREQGWSPRDVSRLLVLPDDRTARRRLERHAPTFDLVFPSRTVGVKRWIDDPHGVLSGVLFLTDANHGATRHRVRPQHGRSTHERDGTLRQKANQNDRCRLLRE